MQLALLIGAACAVGAAAAETSKHHLFVGTYGTPAIYGIEFDSNANTLTVAGNNTTRKENEWLALSYDSKTIYSSGSSGWSSFPITSPTTLGKEASTTPIGSCSSWGGVFILASRRSPYTLYGSLSCGNWVAVEKEGEVGKATAIPYNEAAIIYGMATDPTYNYMYSTDWKGGKIWTHKINADGSLTAIGSVDAPSGVSAPRSIAVHPSGKAIYVVLEAWNALALYFVNETTHLPVYTNGLYPLVPTETNAGNYGAQSVVISTKGTMLWASSRSRVAGTPGYLSGYSLSESGIPIRALFQVPTATSGGKSNNVAACPFSENMVALTESERGSVSIWKYNGIDAQQVASVNISDSAAVPNKGCCSEAVWLD
ncbi:3-carboxy-cis,cis-mucoante lactonizing enzyme [Trichodelitschia bisporula]|uniref:3-carboxy-cis,cis-mucoante lactonizing enzyme n=1 Tax=Trichodelitschia bisporula TaxID=703511 RepID=A0A6G1HM42_9PEZI|nr:3-carboxy-cis,cis-mucoante lactonizing enzyme [Trichodelitschia bisporula]